MNLPDPMTGYALNLGIILDGQLHSAPAIQSRVTRSGQITGDFTKEEVEELCNALNAGSMPAPIRFVGRGWPEDRPTEPVGGDR
jgi:preprotein translocase subunit SecD